VAAVSRRLDASGPPKGSISLLITGDEEGVAVNGTVKMLHWLASRGETLDHCLVGEPSSGARTGDTIKIGRRGSMNVRLRVVGVQGHVAYPAQAMNPIPVLAEFVRRLSALTLDGGSAHFDPSTIAFTTLDVGNRATNVIPGEARGGFNVRFNDLHTPDSLMREFEGVAAQVTAQMGGTIVLTREVSGTAFVTKPGAYTGLLSAAVAEATGIVPQFSTGGGTSDARFIKEYCPVAELGLSGATMHKSDEAVPLADIEALTRIYDAVLTQYFAGPP
jgi:succinyl-diaminopimelate desuccinylase